METYCDNRGFTLVELMITVAIAGLVVAGVHSAYTVQQRSYTAQSQVTEMQQNIRAALNMMTEEIRMAGFDPTIISGMGAGADITDASVGRIRFTQDITEDGDTADTDEDLHYGFSNANDANDDGVADAGAAPLGRQTGGAGGFQPVADNIQAIEFSYLDSGGIPTAVLSDIRSVQISILARAGRPDPDYTNNVTYTPASGVAWDLNGAAAGNAPNDNFRRRLMIATVKCRNLGL